MAAEEEKRAAEAVMEKARLAELEKYRIEENPIAGTCFIYVFIVD